MQSEPGLISLRQQQLDQIAECLRSTSVTADSSGALLSTFKYTAFGEMRTGSGTNSTDYLYTGQRNEAEIGLYFYKARFYDPTLGRFIQPDTLVPDPYNSQDWNRYTYVSNNPIRYNDPSGHRVTCDIDENCKQSQLLSRLSGKIFWKVLIKDEFGIRMNDNGTPRKWGIDNLITTYNALDKINNVLKGNLINMVGGTTFNIMDGGNQYYGQTNTKGVDFHIRDEYTKLPQINVLHETAHLLNMVPATNNAFSGQINGTPDWVKDGYVNRDILGDKFYEPIQAMPMNEPNDPNEYWADAFANYAAGNIKLSDPRGQHMHDFVSGALGPYINP